MAFFMRHFVNRPSVDFFVNHSSAKTKGQYWPSPTLIVEGICHSGSPGARDPNSKPPVEVAGRSRCSTEASRKTTPSD